MGPPPIPFNEGEDVGRIPGTEDFEEASGGFAPIPPIYESEVPVYYNEYEPVYTEDGELGSLEGIVEMESEIPAELGFSDDVFEGANNVIDPFFDETAPEYDEYVYNDEQAVVISSPEAGFLSESIEIYRVFAFKTNENPMIRTSKNIG